MKYVYLFIKMWPYFFYIGLNFNHPYTQPVFSISEDRCNLELTLTIYIDFWSALTLNY